MARLTRYWHGGVPGLKPGDRITPANRRPPDARAALASAEDYPNDPTVVYVTTVRELARFFAACYVGTVNGMHQATPGTLYNVQPKGPLADDPDGTGWPGTQFTCASAVVVAAAEARVTMTDKELARVRAKVMTWVDGTRAYTRDGWALPSPEMRAIGVTPDDMRIHGQWADFDRIQVWPPR